MLPPDYSGKGDRRGETPLAGLLPPVHPPPPPALHRGVLGLVTFTGLSPSSGRYHLPGEDEAEVHGQGPGGA